MIIQSIILLGGKGTRLQELYPDRPKALAPVAGRPFLELQLAWLARHGVRDIHLAAGYKAQAIRDWVSVSGQSGAITVSAEPEPLGTGGGLKFTEPFIRTDPCLVLNGDSLLPNLDFNAFADAGRGSDALASLAVTRIESAGRYGTVEFDDRKRVTAFREKAAHTSGVGRTGGGDRTGGWINGGVYLILRELLTRIEPGKFVSLETDVFPALCAEGRLGVFPAAPPLLDMGTPDGIRAMECYLRNPASNSA